MDSSYTIVVPDAEILSQVCGTNDSNLKLIEEFLGVPVFTCGNEISVHDPRLEIHEKFKHIIDRITDEVQAGENSGADMVFSILHGVEYGSADKRLHIRIPGGVRSVYPKTQNQMKAVEALQQSDLVFLVGPAGSGKTFLAVAEALSLVLGRKKSRLVLTRPVVEAGESLGFLPGDLEQKINPYLRPLYDTMEYLLPRELLRKLTESGIIEIAPLAYMRGRTLSDCAVILDEAQNTTQEQMKMFLTRMGEGSKVFVTGDLSQIDLPRRVPSGLVQAVNIFSEIDEIRIVHMKSTDVVRNPLVKKIIQAYEDAETDE